MRPLVLGTAGHIDHGKTALVQALTGTNTDRLPDEQRRGITIDLGFAHLTLPGGTRLSIVDVPGHEAFVRNMLAGATGIDIVMLVIAADEGPMPQTREHLAILDLLGVSRGVIVLTKVDLVDPEWLDLVRDEVAGLLAGTGLDGSPILGVSARTGAGLDELRAALDRAAGQVALRAADDLFRMPIDRIFTVRGTGTVVTGTVWSGTVRRDAQVDVLPAGIHARVRGIQQHGLDSDEAGPGDRAAIALVGVDRDRLERGDTLLSGRGWRAGGILTAYLRVLSDAAAPIRPRQRVRVHIGTAEVMGRVAMTEHDIPPGGAAVVQLRLERPIMARALDRFVVRSWSPMHTIGGGTILEPAASKRKRLSPAVQDALAIFVAGSGDPDGRGDTDVRGDADVRGDPDVRREPDVRATSQAVTRVEAAVTLAGAAGTEVAGLPVSTGLSPTEVAAAIDASDRVICLGSRAVDRAVLDAVQSALLDVVARFNAAEPMSDGIERESARTSLNRPALFDEAVAALLDDGRLAASGNALCLPGHSPAPSGDAAGAVSRLADVFARAGLEPPELSDLPDDLARRPDLALLIRFLERDGTLVRLSAGRLIGAAALSSAQAALRSQVVVGQELGVADLKRILGLTRKHLIPLLEHFDRTGVTRRTGETRVVMAERSVPADA